MKIRFWRSREFVGQQAIATGKNLDLRTDAEIDPATLSIDARRAIVEYAGSYPGIFDGFSFSATGELREYPYRGKVGIRADVVSLAPEIADAAILQARAEALVRCEEVKREISEREAAQAAERAAHAVALAEREKLEARKSEARELLADEFKRLKDRIAELESELEDEDEDED